MAFPLESIGTGIGSAVVSNMFQRSMNKQEQGIWAQNQRLNFELGQEAQRNSAANMVEGYKKAGLSPALAAGANFSPAAMPAAPSPNKQAAQVDLASAIQAHKAAELADAQEANLAEQTRAQKIENDRNEQADANYNTMMVNTVKSWMENLPKDDVLRSVYQDVLDNPEKFNRGSFAALKDVTDFAAYIKETTARMAQADLDTLIADMRTRGGIYKTMAKMPEEELKLMYQEAYLKRALAMNAYAQANTEGEKQKELQAQQKYLEKQAENVAEDTRRMRFGKYGNMYDHGDYAAAMAEIVGNAGEKLGEEVAKEGVKLGADIVRAKTGTPHGLFRSESKSESSHSGSRGYERETWKDRRGHVHEYYNENTFPRSE